MDAMSFEQSLFKTQIRKDVLVVSTMGWKGGERAPSKRSVESELRRWSRWTKVSGGVSIFPRP